MISNNTTQKIMLDVVIALLPAGALGVMMVGWYSAILILSTVAACVVFEHLFCLLVKRKSTIHDLSAVVTGLILAYNLPPAFPIWMAVVGGFVAIVVVKMCFGGIGQNFANPAVTARIVLLASFPTQMTTWIEKGVDAVSTATPLAALDQKVVVADMDTITSLLMGTGGGSVGEVGRGLLILGGIYLVLRRVITPVIPLTYMGTTVLFSLLVGQQPLIQLLSGGLVLGAIYMATDYATTPMNIKGKVVFGVGCGIITMVIRVYSNLPEGVSYAILIMNILTPLIERYTAPKPFGHKG